MVVPEQTRKTWSEFQNPPKILSKSARKFAKGMEGWNRRPDPQPGGPLFLYSYFSSYILITR